MTRIECPPWPDEIYIGETYWYRTEFWFGDGSPAPRYVPEEALAALQEELRKADVEADERVMYERTVIASSVEADKAKRAELLQKLEAAPGFVHHSTEMKPLKGYVVADEHFDALCAYLRSQP